MSSRHRHSSPDGHPEHVRFTKAEDAVGHCEPMARALTAERFFDFLDDHVGLAVS